mmetsp:Transcript_43521/g.120338  ORF Transcript_43521/g.120338 Transcript_43521/m.120338 type:complete len:482 (+) Transcript_43521:21-1466(+)
MPHNYESALDIVLSHITPVGTRRLAPLAALGAVLAEDVAAPRPHPPFAASIKDGYALNVADGALDYAVVGASRAGASDQPPLQPGEAAYITTGAPLPPGASAVVQVEDAVALDASGQAAGGATPESTRIRLRAPPKPGQDLRPVGFDIAEGDVVLRKGARVGAAEVGVLSTVGCAEVSVSAAARVAVLSTGDELVDTLAASSAGGAPPLRPSAIFDANRPTLLALSAEARAETIDLGVAADEPAALDAALDAALAGGADIVICSGGVSMGDRDLVKPTLARRGTVHFGKVLLKPGKPLTFATVPRGTGATGGSGGELGRGPLLVFGLPGNPVSAFVCFHLFVVPTLRAMALEPSARPRRVVATLAGDVKLDPERPEFHRVVLSAKPHGLLAHSTGVTPPRLEANLHPYRLEHSARLVSNGSPQTRTLRRDATLRCCHDSRRRDSTRATPSTLASRWSAGVPRPAVGAAVADLLAARLVRRR